MIDRINKITAELLPSVIDIRHRLHSMPELACREFQTARLIKEVLSQTSLKILDPFIGTDVVGILHGIESGKNVTLRADIDALPLQEKNNRPYASKIPGLMHGCGHDGHTAILLGTALLLSRIRENIKGSVRFVFQPGEEVLAAGKKLVECGILENPSADLVLALHSWPGLPTGQLSSKTGPIMAAAEFFKIVIRGKGGHGSQPHNTIDPIPVAAKIIEAMQSIVSRMTDPLHPVVISICRIAGGENANVIPDNVELEGTVRYYNRTIGAGIPELIENTVAGICRIFGASYEFSYDKSYIPTINHDETAVFSEKTTQKWLGEKFWTPLERPSMAGEDFAYYLEKHNGAFLMIGNGENSAVLHNSNFDFNDDALRNGIIFLTGATLDYLAS
ncbi:MAG: M20 family metallopeptidase [Victivallaceae bacterium]